MRRYDRRELLAVLNVFHHYRADFQFRVGFNIGEFIHEIAHALGPWHVPRGVEG